MSKNIMKYIVMIVIAVVIIGTGVIAYSFIKSKNSTEPQTIYEKVDAEIAYLETHLLSAINSLNNYNTEHLINNDEVKNNQEDQESSGGEKTNTESQNGNNGKSSADTNIIISTINTEAVLEIDRNSIDWTYIQKEIERISNAWSVITIDLNNLETPNADILTFNDNIENAIKYLNAKDKQNSLISIANLYSLLAKYKDNYSENKRDKELLYIKSDIVSSYALLDANRWDTILSNLGDADTRLQGLINSPDNDINLQKSYILLKEFIKSANNEDTEMCYMKYFYLIKEL
ncbi:MAG: hypothetical protein ACLTXD_00625 [Clostridia bacterium]